MARIHDVTVPLTPGIPTYPGDPPFELVPVRTLAEDRYQLSRMVLSTHVGTHVDAPAHFLAGAATVDQLPLEILLGKARVVELASRERVERADLEACDLRDDLRVLLKTRMSGQLLKAGYQEDHLYVTVDAAHYLAQAGIKLVGFDYLSIDRARSADFPAHQALLGAGVVVVEGLDLSEVEPGEYDMACLPLRVAGGDAAPARVVLRSRA
ncbi:MAG TPA: cyclase family protein [Vicinamibacteria bacterium]|nr:cyclase family protein [Vicinamibacteria bacterium]